VIAITTFFPIIVFQKATSRWRTATRRVVATL
jgi:hypothetical protein